MNRLKHLTYANVVATIALFIALGGGAYAVTKLDKNSVKSKQIKNGQVKSKDIQDGKGVRSKDIQDGAITGAKLSGGSVDGSKIADGSVGSSDLAATEDPRLVGKAGQPSFGDGFEGDCLWGNVPIGFRFDPVGFQKDPLGVVRLSGVAIAGDGPGGDMTCDDVVDSVIYTLPPAYTPVNTKSFPVAATDPDTQVFVVGESETIGPAFSLVPGDVVLSGVTASDGFTISLEGITFRTDGAPSETSPPPRKPREVLGEGGILGLGR